MNEPIKWRVLQNADGKLFLLADRILDAYYYHHDGATIKEPGWNMSWENCDLRKWMNDDFYNAAFSENERSLVLTTDNENATFTDRAGGTNRRTKCLRFLRQK